MHLKKNNFISFFRYLSSSKGEEKAKKLWPLYDNMLLYLEEMADIIRNKSIKMSFAAWPQLENLI